MRDGTFPSAAYDRWRTREPELPAWSGICAYCQRSFGDDEYVDEGPGYFVMVEEDDEIEGLCRECAALRRDGTLHVCVDCGCLYEGKRDLCDLCLEAHRVESRAGREA